MEHLCIYTDALASLVICLAVLRLYEVHHAIMAVWARIFMAAVAASAIYSLFEVLAWREPIPFGMSAFLVLLAVGWGLRAFAPNASTQILQQPPALDREVGRQAQASRFSSLKA